MASKRSSIAQWSRGSLLTPSRPRLQCLYAAGPIQQQRTAVKSANALKYKRKDQSTVQKKKAKSASFVEHDVRKMQQFALCDAMRYIRAFEVGSQRNPKYELHVKLRTLKNGPVVRNRMRLPHPVKTDIRVCVICPPGSKAAQDAKKAGAVLVGEDDVIETIKAGKIEFDRCICHENSILKVNKSGIGRILGPRGLMPSVKTGTVVKNVTASVRDMTGGSEYRERMGVVRMAVGKMSFTPQELQANIKAFMENLKKDMALISDRMSKELHEVVLSSTSAPGFSLNGEFKSADGIAPTQLA
ncbi:hypothetical protein FKW77_006510 [Venturia effusa]|uniref:Mitochondrial 54S ribosomal protein mrpl1 n=1 Tax=Venturia effusa TaxID=50376 RepID=A0A517KZL9_9PEZI|nr:hypothetical protein FKW77_006510 [Venturia effusa]